MRSGRRPPFRAGILSGIVVLALVSAPAALAGFGDKTPLPESVSDGSAGAKHVASSGGGAFVRMIVGLAIVLAVIYGVYWLLKTYGKSKKQAQQGDGRMNVVATTMLAPDRAVHLVRVGDELVLVGTAEKSVTPIRVYRAEDARRLTPLLEAEGGELRPLGGNGKSGWPLTRMVDDLRRRTAR